MYDQQGISKPLPKVQRLDRSRQAFCLPWLSPLLLLSGQQANCGSEMGKILDLLLPLISGPTGNPGRETKDESSSWDQSSLLLTFIKWTDQALQRHMGNRPEATQGHFRKLGHNQAGSVDPQEWGGLVFTKRQNESRARRARGRRPLQMETLDGAAHCWVSQLDGACHRHSNVVRTEAIMHRRLLNPQKEKIHYLSVSLCSV